MSTKERLLEEIGQAPDFLLEEVLNFFLFLKLRLSERRNGSQSVTESSNRRAPNFLRKAKEIGQELSANPTEPLPADFARNLDFYLYGAPKVEE